MITGMTEGHAEQAADIHLRAFKGFFLTFMGRRFLELYYRAVCREPRAIGFVETTDKGEVAGFITGAMNPSGFFSGLIKRDWLRFALASLPAVLRRPYVVPRVLRAFRQPSVVPAGDDRAMIISVGVLPEQLRKGVGTALVEAFLREASSRGAASVYLVTDRDSNEAVNAFYRNAGFSLSGQYMTKEGRWMNEYVKKVCGVSCDGRRDGTAP